MGDAESESGVHDDSCVEADGLPIQPGLRKRGTGACCHKKHLRFVRDLYILAAIPSRVRCSALTLHR